MTFFRSHFDDFDDDCLDILNDSPYHGVALFPVDAYDADPVPDLEDFRARIEMFNSNSTKEVWPWIFLNRMVGYSPDSGRSKGDKGYFRRIEGMDLDDETGARADFEEIFRLSLEMALKLNSPGIVLDPEVYNNGDAYDLGALSEMRGESRSTTAGKLRKLGERLTEIAATVYPDCKILFLFTGIEDKETIEQITLGMLDRARSAAPDIRIIDGGETGLGYYNEDLETLRDTIGSRESEIEPYLSQYAGLLELGGTIAPYRNSSEITGWVRDKAGPDPEMETLRDFEPLIHELFDSYDWLWVYAAGHAKYRAFDPDIAPSFSRGLQEMIEHYAEFGKKGPVIVEQLRRDLISAISLAEGMGADTAAFTANLTVADDLYRSGKYPEAYDNLATTIANAERAYDDLRRAEAQRIIDEAEEVLGEAEKMGIDTERHRLVLERAKISLEEGHYESVASLCQYPLGLKQSISQKYLTFLIVLVVCLHLLRLPPRGQGHEI